jgi:hypothetical protein
MDSEFDFEESLPMAGKCSGSRGTVNDPTDVGNIEPTPDESTRKRVRKACDWCRRKKCKVRFLAIALCHLTHFSVQGKTLAKNAIKLTASVSIQKTTISIAQKCILIGKHQGPRQFSDPRDYSALEQKFEEAEWALREMYARLKLDIISKKGPAEFSKLMAWLKFAPLVQTSDVLSSRLKERSIRLVLSIPVLML